jgi:hypothetical protein
MMKVTQPDEIEMISMTFKISRPSWERIHTYAVKTRQTVRSVLTAAITKYLDEKERPEAAA